MNLKKMLFLVMLLPVACTTGTNQRLTSTEYFSRFNNLAEALRFYPGLMISGTGNQTKVILRKNLRLQNQEPLFVIDGFPVGNDYHQANQIVNMANVTSIRLVSEPSELTTYGSMASAGAVIIQTRHGS